MATPTQLTSHPQLDEGQSFPGGTSSRAYVWAVQCFVVLFLLVVCVGLLNYLGMSVKYHRFG